MEKLLSGKTSIITGASGQIGSAIALELAKEGANVVIHYNTNYESARKVYENVIKLGVKGLLIKASIVNLNEVESMIEKTLDAFKNIDILVNNAGIVRDIFLMMMKEELWDQVIDTNLKGVYYCCKSVLKPMIQQKSGNIVNISSISGVMGRIGQTNYSASKGGIIAFTKSLAQEVGKKGIRVNTVAPGIIDSETVRKVPERLLDINAIPLSRLGRPEEVAKSVLFLASDLSSYITGTVLHINGGLYM